MSDLAIDIDTELKVNIQSIYSCINYSLSFPDSTFINYTPDFIVIGWPLCNVDESMRFEYRRFGSYPKARLIFDKLLRTLK